MEVQVVVAGLCKCVVICFRAQNHVQSTNSEWYLLLEVAATLVEMETLQDLF